MEEVVITGSAWQRVGGQWNVYSLVSLVFPWLLLEWQSIQRGRAFWWLAEEIFLKTLLIGIESCLGLMISLFEFRWWFEGIGHRSLVFYFPLPVFPLTCWCSLYTTCILGSCPLFFKAPIRILALICLYNQKKIKNKRYKMQQLKFS